MLPSNNGDLIPSAIPAKEVTKVALRLKYHVEQVIGVELQEEEITRANSQVITKKVIQTAREAGGKEHKACVIYGLLVCKRWFARQAMLELWDADLHEVRATACEVIAKQMYVVSEFLCVRGRLLNWGLASKAKKTRPTSCKKFC